MAGVYAYSVPITPNVVGEVTEVPVEANTPLNKGDVLFRIDPSDYELAVERTLADLTAKYGAGARLCVLPEGPQTIPYLT